MAPSCTYAGPYNLAASNGVEPTFGFATNNTNDFGIPITFTHRPNSNAVTSLCYTGTDASTTFKPVIKNKHTTHICDYADHSLLCSGLHNSAFPTGVMTLSYTSTASGFQPFKAVWITVSPTSAQYITRTSTTKAAVPTTTITVTPSTTSTVSEVTTQVSTSTHTATIKTCSAEMATSSSKLLSPSAPTPSTPASSSKPTPTTTTVPASTATSFTCPTDDGKSYTTSDDQHWQIQCYTDYEDHDSTSVSVTAGSITECIQACDKQPTCEAAVLSGVACYLKTEVGLPHQDTQVIGAKKVSAPTDTQEFDGAVCPGMDGKNVTTSCGAIYTIECNIDRPGGDRVTNNPVYTQDLVECFSDCNADAQCTNIDWVHGGDDGPCYLKHTKTPISTNSNVDNAIKVKGCTSSSSRVKRTNNGYRAKHLQIKPMRPVKQYAPSQSVVTSKREVMNTEDKNPEGPEQWDVERPLGSHWKRHHHGESTTTRYNGLELKQYQDGDGPVKPFKLKVIDHDRKGKRDAVEDSNPEQAAVNEAMAGIAKRHHHGESTTTRYNGLELKQYQDDGGPVKPFKLKVIDPDRKVKRDAGFAGPDAKWYGVTTRTATVTSTPAAVTSTATASVKVTVVTSYKSTATSVAQATTTVTICEK